MCKARAQKPQQRLEAMPSISSIQPIRLPVIARAHRHDRDGPSTRHERMAGPTTECEDTNVNQPEFDEISGVLRGLVIRLSDRTTAQAAALVNEFIDAEELGLALEWLADDLSEHQEPVATDERSDMLALVRRMRMGARVENALADCPAR
jgi:hypothetical protein